jgi:hypothetical protein
MSSSWLTCCGGALTFVVTIAGCGNTDQTLLLAREQEAALPAVPEQRPDSNDSMNAAGAGGAGDQDDAVVSEPDPESSLVDAGEVVADAGADAAPGPDMSVPAPPVVPPGLCERLGPDPIAALGVAIDAVVALQQSECATARLLEGADEVQPLLWAIYLYSYTHALLDCEGAEIPAGGLEIFALANTAHEEVGLPPRPIGRDDSEQLIRQYLDQLNVALQLSASERASFDGYLRLQADRVVVPNLSGALSTCAASP